ncbi:MAG: hypothetical protein SGPRY_006295 [Prymnesium sp.]
MLRSIASALANLTMSAGVSQTRDSWKPIEQLLRSDDREVWFDGLRVLANLALTESMQLEMVGAGLVGLAHTFLREETNLQVVIDSLGDACIGAAHSMDHQGSAACLDFAMAYAKLALLPAYSLWVFSSRGVQMLHGLLRYNNSSAKHVRLLAAEIFANCMVEPYNQKIFLGLFLPVASEGESGRTLSAREKREIHLKEQEAKGTSEEIQRICNIILDLRLNQPQATVFRAIYTVLEAEAVEDIHRTVLAKPSIAPTLLRVGCSGEEVALIEVCRVVRVLSRYPQVAMTLLQQTTVTPQGEANILDIFRMLLGSASLRLKLQVCQTLMPWSANHKLEVCKAQLVRPLIAFTQSPQPQLVESASAVLSILA